MKSVIGIREEDKAELHVFAETIQYYSEIQQQQVTRYEGAKKSVEMLAVAWKHLAALNLDGLDPSVVRNAEILTHFMEECRDAERKITLNANIVQAIKEALTLHLAATYSIDIKNEWHLDLQEGILSYDSYVEPPQD